MNPTYDFKGQVAFVKGAAMGMGTAAARAFAASGESLVLAGRDGVRP
jgi:NAD(P)-dependent dehydrogenase (short-subunit alcohol dehydrogenase family)